MALQFTALAPARSFLVLAKQAGVRWSDDACDRLGASLAYYALFSIFPLLLLCVTAVGFVLGEGPEARAHILTSVARGSFPEIGPLLDQTLQSMQAHRAARGIGAVVGALTLMIGASGVFSELQASLNAIWRVKQVHRGGVWHAVLGSIKAKALSLLVVIAALIALPLSLVVSATVDLGASGTTGIRILGRLVDMAASLGLLALLLSAMYRIVPQTRVAWRDVFGAALLTSALLAALRSLFSWMLSHLVSYSAYGAVGGMLALLTWIYIVGLVLFYGAEFSRVYAERFGSLSSR